MTKHHINPILESVGEVAQILRELGMGAKVLCRCGDDLMDLTLL